MPKVEPVRPPTCVARLVRTLQWQGKPYVILNGCLSFWNTDYVPYPRVILQNGGCFSDQYCLCLKTIPSVFPAQAAELHTWISMYVCAHEHSYIVSLSLYIYTYVQAGDHKLFHSHLAKVLLIPSMEKLPDLPNSQRRD